MLSGRRGVISIVDECAVGLLAGVEVVAHRSVTMRESWLTSVESV